MSVRALSPRRYFLGFWVWQMLWVYIVSTPVIFINASSSSAAGTPLGAADFVGWGIFVAGFLLQWWADVVKHRFRQVRGRQQREGRGSQGMPTSGRYAAGSRVRARVAKACPRRSQGA